MGVKRVKNKSPANSTAVSLCPMRAGLVSGRAASPKVCLFQRAWTWFDFRGRLSERTRRIVRSVRVLLGGPLGGGGGGV